jgi:hypothetical protein
MNFYGDDAPDQNELAQAQAAGNYIYVDSDGVERYATDDNSLNLPAGSIIPAMNKRIETTLNQQAAQDQAENAAIASDPVVSALKAVGLATPGGKPAFNLNTLLWIAGVTVGGIVLLNVLQLIPKPRN